MPPSERVGSGPSRQRHPYISQFHPRQGLSFIPRTQRQHPGCSIDRPTVFAERGGTSVVSDEAGNVYIAEGQVYIYNRDGKQIGALEVPERPGSLAFGGPDKRTLFIGARSSLYSIRTAAPGR